MGLADRVIAGDRLAAARLITLAENGAPEARRELAAIFPKTGRAHVVGITGPPGAGKSTLVDRLIEHHRRAGRTVGVVAVDPSSPFTGGALLGDRIRMQSRSTDRDVFIRSMSTRGALGGLARAAADAVRVLDALGKDVVFVETVGVGQAEVDIVRLADTVVVVEVPGLGDEIQNLKAGLMEIGHVFVVNKADREGADQTVAELKTWLEYAMTAEWNPPVVETIAEKGKGIPELAAAIADHRAMLGRTGALERSRVERARFEILDIVKHDATREVVEDDARRKRLDQLAARVARREIDPYAAAAQVRRGS
ncbi:MAG: methylmalonyl Co-A mutase-associated GTPase MeaB [Thermoplasmatota archaeon]